MRTGWLVLILVLAGCTTPSDPAPQFVDDFDYSAWENCPSDENVTIACDAQAQNQYRLSIADAPPTGWRCLTMWDERMDDEVHWPRWYTYFGRPAPVEGEPVLRQHVGIFYDTRFDAEAVGGVIQLQSGDDLRHFSWQGGPSGFVELPVDIVDNELLLYGMFMPLANTSGMYGDTEWSERPHYALEITGAEAENVLGTEAIWSFVERRGALAQPGQSQLDGALALRMPGADLYLGMPGHSMGWHDPSDQAGSAHWGGGRGAPYTAQLAAPGLDVNGSFQPYIGFSVHVSNVQSSDMQILLDYICRCYGDPLTTVEGIKCALGLRELPIRIEQEMGSFSVGL